MTLQTQAIRTLAQVRAFVKSSESVAFTLTDRSTACAWMDDCLKPFDYPRLRRADKGKLRRYLATVTGRSRAQIARAITQFTAFGRVEAAARKAKEEAERAIANRTDTLEVAEAQAQLAQALAQLQAMEQLRRSLKR